ncbi:Uncharacterised protein [Halioglobus japonicus]|nr:Uncharacterised protein [Halioglobus japonicus]
MPTMQDWSELEERAREYLGASIELTYDGLRPIIAYGTGDTPYHVFFYDFEGQAGTYIGGTKAIGIPENGDEQFILFTEGE